MRKIFIISFIICFAGFVASAQNFNWKVEIGTVEKSGFYNIQLTPEITAKLKSDYSDIRIFDKNNDEVPYLLRTDRPETATSQFKEYKIVSKEHNASKGYTRLVIHNQNKNEISNFILQIRNSDVKKWLKLNASDDNKNWYVLKDNYYYESLAGNNGTSEIRVLNFPLSNYEYYELLVNDYFDQPINILKAGYLDKSVENGKYTEIEAPKTEQEDSKSSKESIVKISFREPVYIDKLSFEVDYPTFYWRSAHISLKDSTIRKNAKTQYFYNELQTFNLSCNNENTILLDKLFTGEMYLIVKNNDDKPLKIKAIHAYSLNTYLTANLKTDNQYDLYFGNKQATIPVYDLQYFQDSIPKKLTIAKTKNIETLSAVNQKQSKEKQKDTLFIWIAILGVVILLGFMTFKMLNEMKKKNG